VISVLYPFPFLQRREDIMKTTNFRRGGISALLIAAALALPAGARAQGLFNGNPPAQPPARGSGPVT